MTNFPAWEAFPESVASSLTDEQAVLFTSKEVLFSYLLSSPQIKVGFGEHVIKYKVMLTAGGVTVGVMDPQKTKWLYANNHQQTGEGEIFLHAPLLGTSIKLVVAACNNTAGVTAGELRDVEIVPRTGSLLAYLGTQPVKYVRRLYREWRQKITPAYYNLKVLVMAKCGNMLTKLPSLFGRSLKDRYYVIDTQKGGYATRCIAEFSLNESEHYLVTADTGDDTLSIFPIKNGKLHPRRLLSLPKMSSPIYLSVIGEKSKHPRIAVSLFNFDYTGNHQKFTWLAGLHATDICQGNTQIDDIDNQLEVLLRREGYWGFRGTTVNSNDGGDFTLAAADREASQLHILKGHIDSGMQIESVASVNLGFGTEPIGVTGIEIKAQPGTVMYYLSCRLVTDLVVVNSPPSGNPEIVERYQIGGLSRSSVAAGRFKPDGVDGLAFGLWGGDPRDLNATGIGKLVICELRDDGTILGHQELEAGMNPTDVVTGDFDGDGIDEIAVLNYGNGLGPKDRQHTGNVQIFKFVEGSYQCIAQIPVPNPRIGVAIDIDKDGKDELVVSLFFEKRIVVIKCK